MKRTIDRVEKRIDTIDSTKLTHRITGADCWTCEYVEGGCCPEVCKQGCWMSESDYNKPEKMEGWEDDSESTQAH